MSEVIYYLFTYVNSTGIRDGALSLWELNAWLMQVGARTVPNMKDYNSLMTTLGLQVNSNNLVTIDGIVAYYEMYGRLIEDITTLGIRLDTGTTGSASS